MENTSTAPVDGYKDRSTGLIVFGVLQIILGGLCALFVPLMIFGQLMAARATGDPAGLRMMIPSALIYIVLAAAFISIGVGSMKCRRWARALSLVVSWIWLVMGAFGIVFSLILISRSLKQVAAQQNVPQAAMWIPLVIAGGMLTVIFLILPGALVLFYRRQDVKLTCETRDPVTRWTDRIPLPVLALALLIGFGAVSLLIMPVSSNGVMPFFGRLLSGWPGTLFCLAFGVLWGYSAWAIFKLKPAGWWIVFIAMLVFGTSAIVTFQNLELKELYSAMGYPAKQIEQMEQYSFASGKFLSIWMGTAMLPFILFLFYVKKYFRKEPVTS